jgi:hypothetical protein
MITGGTGIIEFKCGSRWCGASPGVVVLHWFDLETGKLVDTKLFKNPKGRPA